MTRIAWQAYLRTRLAILNAARRKPGEIAALRGLTLEQLTAELGLGTVDAPPLQGRFEDLEQSLLQIWLNELSALIRPMRGPARELLVQWARRYEVLNLKALIRGKLGGLARTEIEASLFQLPGFLRLDHEPLLNTDDVPELLRRLYGTPYHNLARIGLRRFEEKKDPFLLDATLDQQFYGDLQARMLQLESDDRTAMQELLGRVVDRHKLIWLLRYRYNYHLLPAEVLYLSIPGGLFLPHARLFDLVNADTLIACLQALPAPLLRLVGDSRDIQEVDSRLVADLYAQANIALQGSPSVLASVFAYLTLRYYELRAVHAIVQARVNRLPESLLDQVLAATPRHRAA